MENKTTAMSVELPSSIVEDIVKAEIVRNLGSAADIVRQIVDRATADKCDCDKHRYNNRGTSTSKLGCAMDRKIEETCKHVLAEWVDENKEKFKVALLAEMKKPKRLEALVGAFADGIQSGSWGVNVELKLKDK